MAGGSVTTEREQSEHALTATHLALNWVWPRVRVDRLQGARLCIGRDDGADIQLHGPGVSRQHAHVNRQGPVYVLHDLSSTNGTWVGGRPIEHVPLAPGSVVRIGEWVGVITERTDDDVEFGELAPQIYGGQEMARLLALLTRAAPSNLPVLLIGETGTGKERLARAVHHFSARRGPFLAVNCAALPEQLAEAELFGYRRGAFTGAERSSPGHFRAAHGGTLFLDEMPDLSLPLQAKLLRVLEDGMVLGLGQSTAVEVDVRIVAATQTPIAQLVQEKRLRKDLGARLNGLELRLPELSQRRADIAPLFVQLIKQHSGGRSPELEARLLEALCLHDWPHNVRELELLARSLLAVHANEPILKRQHLPAAIAALCQDRPTVEQPSSPPRERREYDLARLDQELASNGGNVKAAAESLGISRQRVYRLLDGKLAGSLKSSSPAGDDGDGPRD